MQKLARISPALNAFTLSFDERLLEEIRGSYRRELEGILTNPQNFKLFEGGCQLRQPIGFPPHCYFLSSFLNYPLLWLSSNTDDTYAIYRRFFDALGIEDEIRGLVDHDKSVVVYNSFLVIGKSSPGHSWHVDYLPGANAYTLLMPLFELDPGHGNLLFRVGENSIGTYSYELGDAIVFGEGFMHCTEPYASTGTLRVLACLQFGTDKMEHWSALSRTIASQSDYLILPCGHRRGTCGCPGQDADVAVGRLMQPQPES